MFSKYTFCSLHGNFLSLTNSIIDVQRSKFPALIIAGPHDFSVFCACVGTVAGSVSREKTIRGCSK